MLGVLGLTSCAIITAIGAGVAAVGAIVGAGFGIAGHYQAKDAAVDQKNMQEHMQADARNRALYQRRANQASQERSAAKLRAQMGSTIALDYLSTKQMKYENAKRHEELRGLETGKNKTLGGSSTPKAVYLTGRPERT